MGRQTESTFEFNDSRLCGMDLIKPEQEGEHRLIRRLYEVISELKVVPSEGESGSDAKSNSLSALDSSSMSWVFE